MDCSGSKVIMCVTRAGDFSMHKLASALGIKWGTVTVSKRARSRSPVLDIVAPNFGNATVISVIMPKHQAPFTLRRRNLNTALFLRLGLPYTRYSNRRKFENAGLANLKTELFENDNVMIVMWFPCPGFPQTQLNPKFPLNSCLFKFLRRSVDGKRLIRFQSKICVEISPV